MRTVQGYQRIQRRMNVEKGLLATSPHAAVPS
jgi:hypothetical protein